MEASRLNPVVRPTAWEWAQVALLVLNLAWTTLCLGGFRPETMVVTVLLNGALLVMHLVGVAMGAGSAGGSLAGVPKGGARPRGAPDEPASIAGSAGGPSGPALPTEGLLGTLLKSETEVHPAREHGQAARATAGFHPAGWLVLPFLAYAAANVVWVTPVPWLGWRDWMGWAQAALVFWVVLNGVRTPRARAVLLGALLGLAFVGVVLGCYQRFVQPDWLMMGRTQTVYFWKRASGSFGIPNSLAALLVLVLPVTGALAWRRGAGAVARVLSGYVTAVLAFGLVLTVSRGAWLALALALGAWPLLASRWSWRRRMLGAVLALALVAGIVAIVFTTMPLARARLEQLRANGGELTRPIMWRGAWEIVREHPWWGGGAGSYNVLFEKFRPVGFRDEPGWAHNDYLNTLSDYGLVGLGLAAAAAIVIGVRCLRRSRQVDGAAACDDPMVTSALLVGLGAFALQLLVDFNLKIPALAMSAAVVAGLMVQRRWPVTPAQPSGVWRLPVGLAAFLVAAATLQWAVPWYYGEALRYAARQSVDRLATNGRPEQEWRPVLAAARETLGRAVEIAPENAAAWSDLAYVTALWSHVEPASSAELGREAARAADQALGRSQVVPEFWLRRAMALDLQGRWAEAGTAVVRALTLAPARADGWYQQAFHLSLKRGEADRALAAVAFCLRLDPGNREAQALRQRLIDRERAP